MCHLSVFIKYRLSYGWKKCDAFALDFSQLSGIGRVICSSLGYSSPAFCKYLVSESRRMASSESKAVCVQSVPTFKSYYICSVHKAGTGLIPGRKLTVIISTNLDSGHGRLCALWDTPEANCDLSAFLYKAVMAMD